MITLTPYKEEDYQYFPQDELCRLDIYPDAIDVHFDCIDGEQDKVLDVYELEYEPDWDNIERQWKEEEAEKHKYKRISQYRRARKNRVARIKGTRITPPPRKKSNTPSLYPSEWTYKLRWAIRARDKYQCNICKSLQSKDGSIYHIHHIDYSKDNCQYSNLITLCPSCHMKTNHNREKWIRYFKEPNN